MTTLKSARLASVFALVLAAIWCPIPAVCAQDEQNLPPFMKPTAEHKLLKKDVGTWDATVKVWPMPDAEPIESKGTERNRLLRGGLWLVTRFEGEFFGTPFIGNGQFGYDPHEKKYVGSWIDTMTPHMMSIKSDYDKETKAMTGTAETRDPNTGETYTAKMITRYNDEDDTRIMEMHRKGEDGKEWKVMEISYKRSEKDKDKKN